MQHPSNCSRTEAVTLLELVVGMGLMGTLVVSLLHARTKLIDQHIEGRETLAAVDALDSLLSGWWEDPDTVPYDASGLVPENERYCFKAFELSQRAFEGKTTTVRIELHLADASSGAEPLAVVDLLLPAKAAP